MPFCCSPIKEPIRCNSLVGAAKAPKRQGWGPKVQGWSMILSYIISCMCFLLGEGGTKKCNARGWCLILPYTKCYIYIYVCVSLGGTPKTWGGDPKCKAWAWFCHSQSAACAYHWGVGAPNQRGEGMILPSRKMPHVHRWVATDPRVCLKDYT